MSRFYQQLDHDIVSAKNKTTSFASIDLPKNWKLFSTTAKQQYCGIVSLIPHVKMTTHSRQTLLNTIQSSVNCQIGVASLTRLVDKLVKLSRHQHLLLRLIRIMSVKCIIMPSA